MKKIKILTHSSKVILIALSISFTACQGNKQNEGNQVKEYAVITVEPTTNELNTPYPATIRGCQDIEIRSRVNGLITKLCVDEGETVRKGQTLFIIDPVAYEAAVKVAQANVKVAETAIETSKLTVKNKRELAKKNIISQYELQLAENELATKEAALAQSKAQLANAKNDLTYTYIKSPSNGVVGTIPYRVGSMVGASTTTPLTIVSDIDKMFVYFAINEKQLLNFTRSGKSLDDVMKEMPEVQLQLSDGSIYPEKGKIETISGVINSSTGAVNLRATFTNPQRILRSGGTGSILIPTKNENEIIIPQKATYEIQDKKYVYVVNDSSKVAATEITIKSINDGQNYIVTGGLKSGDKIVVEGISSLRNDMPIKAITPAEAAAKVEAAKQMASGKPAAK